jgi:hypothetical protein
MKRNFLIGFLILFVIVLFAVPVNYDPVDYDVGIEQSYDADIPVLFDAEVILTNHIVSRQVSSPLKYPLISKTVIYNVTTAANTDNSNLYLVPSLINMTSVNANKLPIEKFPAELHIEGLFRLDIGEMHN